MLISPNAKQVLAPALSPGLTSKATIVRSFDVPYALTDSGSYTAAMTSNPLLAYMSTILTDLTPPFEVRLSTSALDPASINAASSYVGTGYLGTYDASGTLTNGVAFSANLGNTHAVPAMAGVGGLFISVPTATVVTVNISNCSSTGYVRILLYNAAGAVTTYGVVGTVGPNTSRSLTATSVGVVSFIALQWVTSSAGVVVASNPIKMGIDISIPTATVSTAVNFRLLSVIQASLIEQFQVSHIRCTGMNMLVTNMASPLDSGGEIVVGRVPKVFLEAASQTSVLMDNIKALPEKKYWRSNAILDGGYVWYLPDDLDSYEPAPLHEAKTDNVLVAAFKMANPNGLVRINCTWRFEFYTPAQVLSRSLTRCWSDEAFTLFELLKDKPACSENVGHMALIAGIVSTVSGFYEFYKAHQEAFDSGAQFIKSTAMSALAPKKKKAPIAPPKPKRR
jgi:hypothetical protein